MANSIGCSKGQNKTRLVDPNNFNGHNSITNVPVSLEDLTISVELTTTKKARTLLTTSKAGISTSQSTDQVTVRFLEGSVVGGKKVFTTKFTDLTTTFDDYNDGENLGITGIDIDFNSQHAPMITMHFVDVRGSAIFQHEDRIASDHNKYSVFFQLPYPLYELTIKGYYGQPVKYCLHMTKFTSRFNSQTGNFEITGSFIGYSYAMLSDMLLGYLKAIEYTSLGADYYTQLKKATPTLLTLNELIVAISNINQQSKKILSNDKDYQQLQLGDTKLEQLSHIEGLIETLGQTIDIQNDLTAYPFIISAPDDLTNSIPSGIVNSPILGLNDANSKTLTDYTTQIKDYIEKTYNSNNYVTLNSDDFKITKMVSNTVTLSDLAAQTVKGIDSDTQIALYSYLNSSSSGYKFDKNYSFYVYDNRAKYTKIQDARNKINTQEQVLKTELANTLKLNIKQGLGFDPTVRSIINVFTTAVEVMLYVLFEVSKKADDPSNTARINELKSVFKTVDNSDITTKATAQTGTNLTPKFYAWPDYRKADQKLGYQEQYLGLADGLKNPTNIPELDFIDNLFNAFMIQGAKAKNFEALLINGTKNWFPVSPLDTRLFVPTSPYKRISGINKDEIVLLVMLRAALFLGYTNSSLTSTEITNMAGVEADAIIANITSPNVLQALANYSESNFLQAAGNINGVKTLVLGEIYGFLNNWYYNYITLTTGTNSLPMKIIPIDSDFQGNWDSSPVNLVDERDIKGKTFVTNYNTSNLLDINNVPILKPDDGGKYIEILSYDEYNNTSTLFDLVSDNSANQSSFKLVDLQNTPADLQNKSNIGFNAMGGRYGIQEFSTLDFGNDITTKSYRFVFYQDGHLGNKTYNKSNGLGLIRGIDGNGGIIQSTTPFDLSVSFRTIPVIGDFSNIIDGESNYSSQNQNSGRFSANTHRQYGNNLILAGKAENSDTTVTYPFVNFNVYYKIGGSNAGTVNPQNNNLGSMAPVSLFGSRLYIEQTDDRAKALLFLHTFPWRGLTENTASKTAIFDINEIINTFGERGGFVSTPKIWAAFIGGMLWRNSNTTDPILFYAGNTTNTGESFIPSFANDTPIFNYPNTSQYLSFVKLYSDMLSTPMSFSNTRSVFDPNYYLAIDNVLLGLPAQAKNEFIRIFNDFVSNEWVDIKTEMEIFNGTSASWKTTYDSVINSVFTGATGDKMLNIASIAGPYTNTNSYTVFSPITEDPNFKYNYALEIKDGSTAANLLIDLFVNNQVIISNSTYKIWKYDLAYRDDPRGVIKFAKSDMKLYVDTIINKLSGSKQVASTQAQKKQEQQNLFGTSDENLIKLTLYKTCKNIYDKWIGGASSSDNIIFRCGGRNDVDTALAVNRGLTTPKLIDSFRFVTRSFRDIGDELAINPIPVLHNLQNNPNTSFYDAVTSLLSSNYFNFTALPSFINYRDPNILESVFAPIPNAHAEVISNSKVSGNSCGPSFVCVYVGESSKHLDFNDSQYTNDGFDVRCINGTLNGLPDDFNTTLQPYEDAVPFFAVNYGQQNQNIFKDISLDQSEFGETAESLHIIDDISRKGAETNRTLAGQNIFNVYSVRSYKVEIEMLGNAMIQPMMYFQLNNIPMFHGAYMITRVKHSIRPNHMSTHFSGVRIRKPETKIFDSGDLFMSILDTIDAVNITPSKTIIFGGQTNRIPNSSSVSDLQDKINTGVFSNYTNIKFTDYGN